MKISETPPISIQDFERISQIITAVVRAKGGNITKSCICYGWAGANILEHHFNLKAQPTLGNAVYALPNTGTLAYYDTPTSSNYHCWVEAEGWYFDFSSIVFPEIVNSVGLGKCERLMMQKPLSQAAAEFPMSYSEFAFHIIRDPSYVTNIIDAVKSPHFGNMIQVAAEWFEKVPNEIPREMRMKDAFGKNVTAIISEKIFGTW